jgi:hypothetical protein
MAALLKKEQKVREKKTSTGAALSLRKKLTVKIPFPLVSPLYFF